MTSTEPQLNAVPLNFADARDIAFIEHGDQEYDGGSFVLNHLDRVVITLLRFGERRESMLIAAVLHDTLEDTTVTKERLVQLFGHFVANVVDYVTDMPGASRRERQKLTYERMRGGVPGDERYEARKLKLADRITNVEASLIAQGKSFYGMYRKEYDFFRAMLHVPGEHELMWGYLDSLMDNTEWKVA